MTKSFQSPVFGFARLVLALAVLSTQGCFRSLEDIEPFGRSGRSGQKMVLVVRAGASLAMDFTPGLYRIDRQVDRPARTLTPQNIPRHCGSVKISSSRGGGWEPDPFFNGTVVVAHRATQAEPNGSADGGEVLLFASTDEGALAAGNVYNLAKPCDEGRAGLWYGNVTCDKVAARAEKCHESLDGIDVEMEKYIASPVE